MKKRNLIIGALVVFTLGLLPACDILEECGTCKLITEDGNGGITEGTPLPLCGDALKERAGPTAGNCWQHNNLLGVLLD